MDSEKNNKIFMVTTIVEQIFCDYCRVSGKTHESCRQAIEEYKANIKDFCDHTGVLINTPEGYRCLTCKMLLVYDREKKEFVFEK